MSQPRSTNGSAGDTGLTYRSYRVFNDLVRRSGEPQVQQNVNDKPGNKCGSQTSGERLQLAGNDDGAGTQHHRDRGLGHQPDSIVESPTGNECVQHHTGSDAAGAGQRNLTADSLLGDFHFDDHPSA